MAPSLRNPQINLAAGHLCNILVYTLAFSCVYGAQRTPVPLGNGTSDD